MSSIYRNLSTLLFCSCVMVLFVYLNRIQPHYYIDEMFHIPQTLRYCDGNFTQWDQKITTLPGLYLVTALILSPLNLCYTIYIRCVNLFGTFINFYLIYTIIKQNYVAETKEKCEWTKLMGAYNITLLPPLFFWHFLYYTDVVSLNLVLVMLHLHLRKRFKFAAFAGLLSITIRQTNVIWLVLLAVERALDLLDLQIPKSVLTAHHKSPIYVKVLWTSIIKQIQGPVSFVKFVYRLCADLFPYAIVCVIFLLFIIWNKGIVVGDRTAHVATIHIPQLLYFSLFAFAFSWPYMIVHWKAYLTFVSKHWIVFSFFLAGLTVIVHTNTLVHPYVLADNRHYVFYFWNRFMGKAMYRYLLIPVYTFTLYTLCRSVSHLRFMTRVNYACMVALVLVPQLLLETRYFLVPYVFYRLNLERPKRWQIVMEFLTMIVVNFLQFFVFVNKVFYWDDLPGPQRISW